MLIYVIIFLLCALSVGVLAGRTLRAPEQSYLYRNRAERVLVDAIELTYLPDQELSDNLAVKEGATR
nr:MAG TPA: hypothetical protein [Caudoviricetes sp.]